MKEIRFDPAVLPRITQEAMVSLGEVTRLFSCVNGEQRLWSMISAARSPVPVARTSQPTRWAWVNQAGWSAIANYDHFVATEEGGRNIIKTALDALHVTFW